jgi:hypothetical protein
VDRQRTRNPITGGLLLIGIGLMALIKAFYLREG